VSTLIPIEELFEHAKIAATIQTVARTPGMEGWARSRLLKEPTKIYDINGELLFLDFPVRSAAIAEGDMGYVRASASKEVGTSIISYELGPKSWDFDAAVKKLKPLFSRSFPKLKIVETKLVCYSYPKLGVMFSAVDASGASTRHIFDVASLKPVPERKGEAVEGFYAWSYLDSAPEGAKNTRLRQYEENKKSLGEIPEREKALMLKTAVLGKYVSKYTDIIISWFEKKLLQYCTHYNYTEPRSHHCFVLQGQQVDDYCAVATCQMILCYYRYYYTQDQIAPALNYAPGGCPADQSAGYETLTCNHLDATFDTSPTWAEIKSQIDALHPLKSGISGHARACAGYYRNLFMKSNSLYIYDPWPNNVDYKLAGTVKWEDWNSITHTNCVYTKLTCP
jgi:hypothetical protein